MNINIQLKNKKQMNMTIEEFCRWGCLLEAIEHLNGFAFNNKNIDIENNKEWIKQKPFLKYIEERFPAMLYDLNCDVVNNKLDRFTNT